MRPVQDSTDLAVYQNKAYCDSSEHLDEIDVNLEFTQDPTENHGVVGPRTEIFSNALDVFDGKIFLNRYDLYKTLFY